MSSHHAFWFLSPVIVTPCPHGLEEFVGKSVLPRTPGLHISEIYGDLYRRLEPGRYKDGPPDPLRLEAGLAFEAILEEGLKQRLSNRPGEFVTQESGTPIYLSPDLIIFNSEVRVGELKLSWLSCKELPLERSTALPPKFSKWCTQIKAYCHIVETPYARLIGFFVNGDYRPMAPKLLAWDLEFTSREIRDNWIMLMNHGKTMGVL